LKEYDSYKKDTIKKQNDFEQKFQEQEETIKELALKLEGYITRQDESNEKVAIGTSTWMKDDDVKECCQCKKDFNALRRKHHCRQLVFHRNYNIRINQNILPFLVVVKYFVKLVLVQN